MKNGAVGEASSETAMDAAHTWEERVRGKSYQQID